MYSFIQHGVAVFFIRRDEHILRTEADSYERCLPFVASSVRTDQREVSCKTQDNTSVQTTEDFFRDIICTFLMTTNVCVDATLQDSLFAPDVTSPGCCGVRCREEAGSVLKKPQDA